ncbi:MAG: 2-methoxy-6-polyprenyl-1,4-benzoquinol methylase, mitochondrial [Chroococcidiopsis sp. SAG 2025]|uniref:class I SAM-dependent methyltransferase n=1 Tax=Chroococcidiopsis sp. SAG 2025 TaxID=171389 RepID=UPI0029371194|nr:methyltransferase domain-containing protein [Chroococcidiopsis sp. SAG 2025]MDV2992523.1 2-methoxy-6-polyprenyl-1,4-benzoquinol methylase, mitochondrial [Chroococcidiopsis sp. SAG 2025]
MHRRVASHQQALQTTGQTVRRWAHLYDVIVGLVTLGKERDLREMTAQMAGLKPSDKVLDVGCGTGSLAIALKTRVGATGEVYGIDASPEMVEVARRKASQIGMDIAFQVGLIENIPFPDCTFDVVLSSMMLHHLPGDDLKRKGFAEMQRDLKLGGSLSIVDIEPPASPLLRILHPILLVHFWVGIKLQDYQVVMEATGFTEIEVGKTRYSGLAFIRGRASKS